MREGTRLVFRTVCDVLRSGPAGNVSRVQTCRPLRHRAEGEAAEGGGGAARD